VKAIELLVVLEFLKHLLSKLSEVQKWQLNPATEAINDAFCFILEIGWLILENEAAYFNTPLISF